VVKFQEEKQKSKLEEIKEREEEELVQVLAQKYQIPYTDLSKMSIDLDYLKLIPEETSRDGKIAVFQGVAKKLQVGMRNPDLPLTQNTVKELEKKGYIVQPFLISMASLKKAWARYKEVPEFVELSKGLIDISPERIEEFLLQATSLERIKEIFLERVQSGKQRRISELLEILLSGALGIDASDLHIEPREDTVHLRYRLDGVLHDVLDFDKRAYNLVLSRIKLVSEMKLNVKDQPQDGRFTIAAKKTNIEVRASALPGPYGESIVLRILNPETIRVDFKALGMHPTIQKIMEHEIKRPNGMILNTGPTGSGKTTTLYAFLNKIKSPSTKIITLEEPIEYHLIGITQTQTNKSQGYTFATGLRAILRQDPDVIMVGEIRDLEAAGIALNAALTGHLVLSTLHTNDAAGTIPRLIDLGANTAIIGPAINVAMAQRLVRILCDCKKEAKPSKEEFETLKNVLNSLPDDIEKPDIKNIKTYVANGCEKCSNIGFKGRVGIFEVIIINANLENIILANPSITLMREEAKKQAIMNMQQDVVLKIIEGITSIEEARRVIEL